MSEQSVQKIKAVLWNDVKAGAVVRSSAGSIDRFTVMDNKKGVTRNVKASNGDVGSMYVYRFTEVQIDGQWHPLAITHDQARICYRIAASLSDQRDMGIISRMEENYAQSSAC